MKPQVPVQRRRDEAMDILNVLSPNYSAGRKGYRPEAIVIHIMEGTLSGTDSWFRNRDSKVSAHYGVGVNGEVHRYVEESDTAWHAGRVDAPHWTLIKPAGEGRYVNPNYYTIGIEHEGKADSDWTDAMYEASSQLVADISRRWSIPVDRLHVIGHREIFSLKTCPGSKVDLDKIVKMANLKAGTSVPSQFFSARGSVVTTVDLNKRRNSPSTAAPLAGTVPKGTELTYSGYTEDGQKVKGVSRWYRSEDGLWFWGGGVKDLANQRKESGMGNSISTSYQLKNIGEHVTFSVKIGDAQKGVSTVMIGSDTIVSRKEGDFTVDLGEDNRISGQNLVCSTVSTAVRKETKHTSVTVTLKGGIKPFEQTMEEVVQNQGDEAIYSAAFLFF